MIKGAEAPNFILLINPTSNYCPDSLIAVEYEVNSLDQSYSVALNRAYDPQLACCTKGFVMGYCLSKCWLPPSFA